jgi:hypothetical protein
MVWRIKDNKSAWSYNHPQQTSNCRKQALLRNREGLHHPMESVIAEEPPRFRWYVFLWVEPREVVCSRWCNDGRLRVRSDRTLRTGNGAEGE